MATSGNLCSLALPARPSQQANSRPNRSASCGPRLENIFFAASTPDSAPNDYHAAVTGALALAPSGNARRTLAEDYERMVEDRILLDDAEPFAALLRRCQALADKVNAAVQGTA